MKKNTFGEWMLLAVGVPLAFGVAWLMALAGEPRSAWLMCDIFKLCGAAL